MKVNRNLSVDTKRVTRRKVTSARRPKTLKTRQTTLRRKTALNKGIVVERSSGRVENLIRIDWHKLSVDQAYHFLMARDIAKESNKENKIADHVTGKRRQSHE